jgi:N6-adenosine-specific RNA methylase IME4
MTTLAQYERARAALAEIKSLPEAVTLMRGVEHLRLHAKQVRDRALMAEAAEIQFKAEIKLGEMLIAAKERGEIREGRPRKRDENDTESVSFSLKEIGLTARESQSAQQKASISERAQLAMVERIRDKILSGGATVIDHVASTEDKKAKRAAREKVLAAVQTALPNKRYGVIYADPEWRFEVYSRDTGMDRAADNHYPTSATDAICARPVGDIAADDCVLFLWATVPMLPDALKVMAAWGFTYKSHCIWAKDKVGTGYWFRNSHELLLVGTKGNIPAPAMGTQWTSTIEGRVTRHSAKPERFYELIEEYFPSLPKIELNARHTRKGWDAWGNEADVDQETGEIIESESIPAPQHEDTVLPTAPVRKDDDPSSFDIPEFLRRKPA